MSCVELLLTVAEVLLGLLLPVVFYIRGVIKRRSRRERSSPKDVVVFHHPGRGPWVPSMIPFAVKLETYLRMAKIPYQSVHGLATSPKGKFPWIEHNGKIMGDSTLIIKYLNKEYGVDLNKHLSREEKATARAYQVMGEEQAYWTGFCYRWWINFDIKLMTRAMRIPSWIVTWYLSRLMKKQSYSQGMGRHSKEEIKQIMIENMQALSDFIGTKKFLMGDTPCEQDCSVFGILSQVRWNMPGTAEEGVRLVEDKYPVIRDYCDRMKDTFWPDWEECITFGGTRKATK